MSTGEEAAPTAALNSGAPAAPGNPAPQLEGVVGDGAADAGVGPGLGDRFDGGRLATVLQGSAADQQVTPASTVAAAMEQPLPAQSEQPGLANAAQFLPFVQLPQQPASVPLQQPASQPAAGDDAAEQQRILQQSAQLQQQQVGDLRFRLGRHSPVQGSTRGAVMAKSAGCSLVLLRSSIKILRRLLRDRAAAGTRCDLHVSSTCSLFHQCFTAAIRRPLRQHTLLTAFRSPV